MYEIPPTQLEICKGLLKLFTIEGKPALDVITPGQMEIFYLLIFRPKGRAIIVTPTQYGKSLIIALACIILTCVMEEIVAVVAPKTEKARIIMRYYIDHLGDNAIFAGQLEKNTRLERLRMEENKERIILRNKGGIYVLSANVSAGMKTIEAAMGEGAKVVLEDESCLIPDNPESTIFRMIAGKKDAFYAKIGNPFYLNHFFKSWHDPMYFKIFISVEQAIREGRYAQGYIDEARRKPYSSVLYPSENDPRCGFPDETQIDMRGYVRLLTDEEIEKSQVEDKLWGEHRVGVDVAEGGGNFSIIVSRWANYAKKVMKYQTEDTMDVAAKVANYVVTEQKALDQNVFIDSIGVGKGVYDRLVEHKMVVTEVKGSEKAEDPVQFANKRAECYWRLRQWIKLGGKLEPDQDWWQLASIKYKVDISGHLLMMPKELMLKEGIESPDVADALSLTFARKSILNPNPKTDKQLISQFDAHQGKKKGLGAHYPA